jgi:DNA polymerase III sliding clamp (beta) subunit (PCNA family)
MDTMKWLELATSKDKTRFNLNSVYRDATALVATDGHRLHLSNGLPEVTPHYTDGTDAEYPDWKQVMPDAGRHNYLKLAFSPVLSFTDTKQFLTRCKKIATLLKSYQKIPTVKLSAFDGSASIDFAFDGLKLSLTLPCEIVKHDREQFEPIGLNFLYFVDALQALHTESLVMRIEKPLAPIHFVGSENKQAIIMPMRLS